MCKCISHVMLGLTLLFSVAIVVAGLTAGNASLTGAGAVGVCYVLLRLCWAIRRRRQWQQAADPREPAHAAPPVIVRKQIDPNDIQGLVEQMMEQGRCALLLRPQVVENLTEEQFRRTIEALEESMALVPDGEVVLGWIDDALEDGKLDAQEMDSTRGRVIQVDRLFLDRYPVTNRQFYEFVAAGGYEQTALWEESILTAVLDFVDRKGMPGPRYWQNGCYAAGTENHPLVGVSWYEAGAYARWLGKRLPTDAEWVKAGSWPVKLSASTRLQRRYPWGNMIDLRRANLWGSGPGGIVPVERFPDGVSVGGVHQLIGNVWEWTAGNFRGNRGGPGDPSGDGLMLPSPMKSIRGGAFDTYFDNQATCQFQSGENPLSRRHNIGFRCAVGICDLVLSLRGVESARPAGEKQASTEVPAADDRAPTAEEVRV